MLFNISDNFDAISIKFISIVQKYLKKNPGVENLRISIKIDNNDLLSPIPAIVNQEPLVQWKVKETHVKEKVQVVEVSEVETKKNGNEVRKMIKPGTRHLKSVVISSEVEEKIVGLKSRVNVHEKLIVGCGVKTVFLNDVEDFYEVEKEKNVEMANLIKKISSDNVELKKQVEECVTDIKSLEEKCIKLTDELAEERATKTRLREEIVSLKNKLLSVSSKGDEERLIEAKDNKTAHQNETEIDKRQKVNESLMRSMFKVLEEAERINDPRVMMSLMRQNLTDEERATFNESATESEDEFAVMVSDDD